ncbi:hypothetical protein WICMUC_001895 [Wickerhamomyces mucosus]|uniref:Uncharacterized protein n=1 Tax=Wickerhamomyces mucosus TaxID=1378264 RepID=A0A9P8PT32_9ASCO|nr:hypothetical protein WICMUC_001895 [Wickerhamomyces mucosus]
MITMSAASIAISVPVEAKAIPKSAVAKAGESLIPSPMNPTLNPCFYISPCVKVPVLSNNNISKSFDLCKTSPPLIKIPLFAATPVPTMTAVGAANPNAQGHATTITEIAIFKHTKNLSPCMKISGKSSNTLQMTNQQRNVNKDNNKTLGTKMAAILSAYD